ncbi:MAG: phosphatidate cytidylyltransferase [Alphaproteobacteria bacterium]|nr:phosphatidate cytidylyltransferase [Alphaproteobacteria bacterium]
MPDATNEKWSGLKARILSALALALVVISLLYVGGLPFMLLVLIAALIMMREWNNLVINNSALERTLGMAYVAVPCACLIWLRGLESGLALTLCLIAIVCATDIGAFFAGRQIGGPKLAPSISPNKTWAGLGGGVLCAAIASAIAHSFVPFPATLLGAIGLGALLAVLAQGGDLLESWMKRRAGVKDSGTLLPGHGGLLDRADGYIFTLPMFALLLWLQGI